MFYGPIFSEGVDNYLFDKIIDPILPGRGLPIPLPVRLGLFAIELQVEAGQAIAAGEVTGMYQYTGQAAQAERARSGNESHLSTRRYSSMTETEIAIEESKTERESRTARFA